MNNELKKMHFSYEKLCQNSLGRSGLFEEESLDRPRKTKRWFIEKRRRIETIRWGLLIEECQGLNEFDTNRWGILYLEIKSQTPILSVPIMSTNFPTLPSSVFIFYRSHLFHTILLRRFNTCCKYIKLMISLSFMFNLNTYPKQQ